MALYEYKIGAGHNLPAGSLTNIEDVQPTGDRFFEAPNQWGNYSPGVRQPRPGTSDFISGDPSDAWEYGFITRAQEKEFRDRFLNGGYSGPVTYTTMADEHGVYTRRNAICNVPLHPETSADRRLFPSYTIDFAQVSGTLV